MTAPILDELTPVGNRAQKLHHLVAEQLGGQIVHGSLQPYQELPREQDLAEACGVSRTVVRSALSLLEAKGLIEIRHGRGNFVRPATQWNLLDQDVLRWILCHGRPLGPEQGVWQGTDLHKAAAQFADIMHQAHEAAPELRENPVYLTLVVTLCAAGYSDAPLATDTPAPVATTRTGNAA